MAKYSLIDKLLEKRKTPKRQTLKSIPLGFATMRVGNSANEYMQGLVSITKDGRINDATAKTMTQIAKDIMRKYTSKMQGTGALSKSFFVQKERIYRGEAVYSVQSSVPYATVWTHQGILGDMQGSPGSDKLADWMNGKRMVDPAKWSRAIKGVRKKSKSHLAKNPTREQIEASVGFLISRSIREARNNHPTKKSKLRKLSGTGSRMYDYPAMTMKDMIPELEKVKIRILKGLE